MERPFRVPFSELSTSYLSLFLFLLLLTTNEAAEHSIPDLVYLMAIKENLTDPYQKLHNWNSSSSPCTFNGVKCDKSSTHVMELDLGSFSLEGSFPTAVCNLQNITFLSLANNSIMGEVPKDLTNCGNLSYLNLSQNLLIGALPDFISELSSLEVLDLSSNNFSGPIPLDFARLGKLQTLDLYYNLLGGNIPSFLGNLTNLVHLRLTQNPFDSGVIPPEIGNMIKLQQIWLRQCNLTGEIPDSFGGLSELQKLDVSQNNLTGLWPGWTSNLVKLTSLQMYTNRLGGGIPADIGKMSSLEMLDVSGNMLTGSLPDSLGNLGKLTSLHLMNNQLTGAIPASLENLTMLRDLSLFKNSLHGEIPQKLGRNTQLEIFDLSENQLSGPLPSHLCNGGKLSSLHVFSNTLNGSVSEYGNCTTLVRLRLSKNQFSGEVPKDLWGFPGLELVELSSNRFEGSIPTDIRNAKSLSKLAIDDNEFSGAIFPSIGSVWTLALINLKANHFSGEIPTQIGNLQSLTYLDLSENHLTNKVPASLGNLHLIFFNVSSNQLSGLVPSGLIKYKRAFLENPKLCGDGFADIKPCTSKRGYLKIVVLTGCFFTASVVLVVGLWCFYKRRSKLHPRVINKSTIDFCPSKVVSFRKLVFHEHEIVNSLSEANVIGTGGAGKVYKIILGNGETVAVKRLPGSTKTGDSEFDSGFKAEIETLGVIRHKNIVKLWGGISLSDSNLLIYEYMSNGSIGNMLHDQKPCSLDWPTRYMIALDSAQGLAYLHYDCNPPIIHCDIKSNNILLDEELHARVADFGLAKILRKCNKGYETVFAVAGSYGYIAPEVSYSPKVTAKNDVYSFGVVLLELVTSRRPVDPSYGEGANIVKWVNRMLEKENGLEEILDHQISEIYKDSVLAVLRIALDCTNSLPFNRPNMRHVIWMLQSANPNGKTRTLTTEPIGNEPDTIHL
ncbi:hypothetical protein SUGI_0496440 [Cryptomeria japonica]|nr:hypothetical protein SUGI_0496440 [Cryptomeria japonica]